MLCRHHFYLTAHLFLIICIIHVSVTVVENVADPVFGVPDPDPLVRGTDPAPDPSINKQK
jgi:hypothetical protein